MKSQSYITLIVFNIQNSILYFSIVQIFNIVLFGLIQQSLCYMNYYGLSHMQWNPLTFETILCYIFRLIPSVMTP